MGQESISEEFSQSFVKRFGIFCPTFPYDKHFPASFPQRFDLLLISFDISISFVVPIFSVRNRRDDSVATFVLVPETAVNKYYLSTRNENKIGSPRQVFLVKRITIAHGMN